MVGDSYFGKNGEMGHLEIVTEVILRDHKEGQIAIVATEEEEKKEEQRVSPNKLYQMGVGLNLTTNSVLSSFVMFTTARADSSQEGGERHCCCNLIPAFSVYDSVQCL